MTAIWKSIYTNDKHQHEISTFGEYKCDGILQSPKINKNGEPYFSKIGDRTCILLKSLVAQTFIADYVAPDKNNWYVKASIVKRYDPDKSNNKLDNLYLYCESIIDPKNLKFGFSYKMNEIIKITGDDTMLIQTYLMYQLLPDFEEYFKKNDFILGRHFKPTVKFNLEDKKYHKTIEKENEIFNNFKISLHPIIDKIAIELGYQKPEKEESYIFVWKGVMKEIGKYYKCNNRCITKKTLENFIGYDIFPYLKNNADVYLSDEFEAWERKIKIKNLLK